MTRIVPSLIVCSCIYPFSDTSKMEARSIHYTFHLESANRIVELVFHATHPLTFNGKVENCLFSVLMSEGKYVIFGFDVSADAPKKPMMLPLISIPKYAGMNTTGKSVYHATLKPAFTAITS